MRLTDSGDRDTVWDHAWSLTVGSQSYNIILVQTLYHMIYYVFGRGLESEFRNVVGTVKRSLGSATGRGRHRSRSNR